MLNCLRENTKIVPIHMYALETYITLSSGEHKIVPLHMYDSEVDHLYFLHLDIFEYFVMHCLKFFFSYTPPLSSPNALFAFAFMYGSLPYLLHLSSLII